MNFGKLLKTAREAQNLTLEEVAEQLNLRVSLIRDLENGRIDRHTADVFTRGYVKSYADLLKIDSAEVLEVYDICAGNTANRQEKKKKEDRQRRKQKKKKIAISLVFVISFLICISLVVGVVFYLWVKYSEPAQLVDGPLPFADRTDIIQIPDERVTIEDDPNDYSKDEQIVENIDESINLNDQTDEGSTEIAEENTLSAPEVNENKVPNGANEIIKPTVDVDISRGRHSQPYTFAEIATAQNYVVFVEFSSDCWFELRSGTAGRKVTSKVYKASQTAEFTLINMPLHFKFGAPQGVSRLVINNYEIDLSGAEPNRPYNLEIITK